MTYDRDPLETQYPSPPQRQQFHQASETNSFDPPNRRDRNDNNNDVPGGNPEIPSPNEPQPLNPNDPSYPSQEPFARSEDF